MAGFSLTLASLLATLLAAAALAGLGALAMGFRGQRWADLGVGWGALGLALLLTSAVGLPLLPVALPLLLAGLGAFAWRWRWRPSRPALLLATLLAPLVVMAAAMPLTAWDDYAHWLANARYLLDHNHFPGADLPAPISAHGGYPYAVALLTYAASLPLRALALAPMAETAAPVFYLLLLAVLAAGVLREAGVAGRAWAVAGVVLALFWLNPAFVPRIVFTNYGETPTAALAGMAALLLLRRDRAAWWQAALLLAALVNVKQTGLVLALLLLAGAALLAIVERQRDRDGIERRRDLTLPLLALPMLLTWWLWQPHAAAAGGVFGFKPLGQWAWALAPQTLAAIGTVIVRKLAFSALLLALLALAALALWRGRRDPAARLALLAAPLLAGWPCFLFVTYMGGSFNDYEITHAASFWRYGTQLGGVMLVGALLWLLAQRVPARLAALAAPRWALPLALGVLVVLPAPAYSYLWPAKRELAPPLRRTMAALLPSLPQGGVLAVVDPEGNGFGAVIAEYALQGRVRVVLPARGYGSISLEAATLRTRLAEDQPGQILLLSADTATQTALATPPLRPGHWRLLRRNGAGWVAEAERVLGR